MRARVVVERRTGTPAGYVDRYPTSVVVGAVALRMLEEAVKLDPNYAVAYAQLGWAYTWVGLFSRDDAGPMWIERARGALARADALDLIRAPPHLAGTPSLVRQRSSPRSRFRRTAA